MSETTIEPTSRECALIAARAADGKKATDIMVQEVRDLIGVTDYFVIATAANSRQVEAIVDEIEEAEREQARMKPLHREGTQDGTWSLLDYGSFVVHVFQPETREYYRLEALWNDAPVVDLAAEAGLDEIEYSDRIAKLLGRAYSPRFLASMTPSRRRVGAGANLPLDRLHTMGGGPASLFGILGWSVLREDGRASHGIRQVAIESRSFEGRCLRPSWRRSAPAFAGALRAARDACTRAGRRLAVRRGRAPASDSRRMHGSDGLPETGRSTVRR